MTDVLESDRGLTGHGLFPPTYSPRYVGEPCSMEHSPHS
jgi:hypothetical protein